MKRKLMMAVGVCLVAATSLAGVFDDAVFRGKTEKPDPTAYGVGEKIVFRLALEKAPREAFSGEYAVDWRRWGDDGKETTGRLPVDGKTPLSVTTSLDRPGGVFLEAFLVNAADGSRVRRDKLAAGHPSWEGNGLEVQFLGSALVEPGKLRAAHDEPEDFEAFWKRQKDRLAAVPAAVLERKEVTSGPNTACRVWQVKIACAGPRPVTGFLSIPRKAKSRSLKAVCQFIGYGVDVRKAPADGPADRIFFSVNAHGYDLDREKEYYDEFLDGIRTPKRIYAFSAWQNEYPEGSYFNGMALRVMRAYDFVRTLPEWDGVHLEAEGGSQGGLQTMWAAGLVKDLTEARPEVPWCADLGGEAVEGRVVPGWRIAWTKGLSYYDSANHAKRAKCCVKIVRAGLGDTCCVPSGVAILYNNLPPQKRSIVWVQGSKHGYVPPQPNQSVELPSGKTVSVRLGEGVYTGRKLP